MLSVSDNGVTEFLFFRGPDLRLAWVSVCVCVKGLEDGIAMIFPITFIVHNQKSNGGAMV